MRKRFLCVGISLTSLFFCASAMAQTNLALNKPTQLSSVYSSEYAGAMCVDGNKGNFCHSTLEPNPWWQVDLQGNYAIGEIVVTNRDGYGERSRTITALVSSDGQNWQRIYTHNGTNFATLSIPGGNRTARFVRLQLAANEYLNLSEVEVHGQPSGSSASSNNPVPTPVAAGGAPLQGNPGESAATRWNASFNGHTGPLELTATGGGWRGRFDIGSGWEEMTNLRVDRSSISWHRVSGNQDYIGQLGAGGYAGTFTYEGHPYLWSAKRVDGGGASATNPERELFSTCNDGGASNGGKSPVAVFANDVTVTEIMTYHWNDARGAPQGGSISLLDENGQMYGPWTVKVVNNVYWYVYPKTKLPAGSYRVIDSEPSTWSQNGLSKGFGHVRVKGALLNASVVEVHGSSNSVTTTNSNSVTTPKKSETQPALTFGKPGGVTVTVPDGLVAKDAVLTVTPSATAAQLPKPAAAAKILGAYDIRLGNTSEFAREIQIEIPYDPAALDPNSPEGKNLWVSSWDPKKSVWAMQRAEVDTTRKRLIVHTNHLSTWLYWTLQGYKYVEAPDRVIPSARAFVTSTIPPIPFHPFVVYYYPGDAQPRVDGVPSGYVMKNLADDVLAAMIEARTAYQDAGFNPIDYQVNAIITDSADSIMDPHSGNVILKRSTLTTLDLLRHDSGHELFHVVQNQYLNAWGMESRLWWIEGTPDYASAVVAWKVDPTPRLDPDYFDESLFLNERVHAYQNNQFIRYLVTVRKMNFKAMWDAVVTQSAVGDNGEAAFRDHVSHATGKSFASVWADYVDDAMFGPHPLGRAVTKMIAVTDSFKTGNTPVDLPDCSARGVLIRPKLDAGKPAAHIKISATNLTDGATVEIWKILQEAKGSPDRSTGKLIHVLVEASPQSPALELDSKHVLEAIVINPGLKKRSVTITAEALTGPIVTLSPSRIDNVENKIYNFSLKIDDQAASLAKVEVEWDFGDKSDLVSYTDSRDHAKRPDGYDFQISHRFNRLDANLTVKARVFDRTLGRVLVAEAAAQVTVAQLALRTVKVSNSEEITGYYQGDQLIKKHGISRFSQSDGTYVEEEYQDGKRTHVKIFNEDNHHLMVEMWLRGEEEFKYKEIHYSWDGRPEFEWRRLDKNSPWQSKTSTGEWFDTTAP